MNSRGCSTCCLATFTPFLTWIWGLLIGAGLGLWYYFVLEAKASTEEVVYGVLMKKQNYEQIKTVALVTTIVLAAFTGFAMIASVLRTRIALGTRKGLFPRTLCNWYLSLMYPILSILCLCLVWLVLLLMGVSVWTALLAIYDMGVKYLSMGSLVDQWQTLQQESGNMTNLVSQWDSVKQQASTRVYNAVNPGVLAVQKVLATSNGVCPQFCINLANFGNLVKQSDPNKCLCSFSRLDGGRKAARDAWMRELPWVLLGLGLAWIGMTLLVIEIQAHLARTWCERNTSSSAAIGAEGADWLAASKKGGAVGENMHSSNLRHATEAPSNSMGCVASTNAERSKQQSLGATPTAADADSKVQVLRERHHQEQLQAEALYAPPQQAYYNAANDGGSHMKMYQVTTYPEQEPWSSSQPTESSIPLNTYGENQASYGGYAYDPYSVPNPTAQGASYPGPYPSVR